VASVAPGWYRDPVGSEAERFWDGERWTARVKRPRATPRVGPFPPPEPAPSRVGRVAVHPWSAMLPAGSPGTPPAGRAEPTPAPPRPRGPSAPPSPAPPPDPRAGPGDVEAPAAPASRAGPGDVEAPAAPAPATAAGRSSPTSRAPRRWPGPALAAAGAGLVVIGLAGAHVTRHPSTAPRPAGSAAGVVAGGVAPSPNARADAVSPNGRAQAAGRGAHPPDTDGSIRSCSVTAAGVPTATGTVVNHSTAAWSYRLHIGFFDATRAQVGDATAVAANVAPGGTADWRAAASGPAPGRPTCLIAGVDRVPPGP